MSAAKPSLAELGWRPFFSAQLSEEERVQASPVRVMAAHRGSIAIAGEGEDQLVSPHISGADGEEAYPVVGDWLLVDRETSQLLRILGRASLFKRRAPGHARRLQLIAANVDTVFLVASCNQDFNLARLERYLVLAREVGVDPVVVLTKIDLAKVDRAKIDRADDPEALAEAARGLQPGLRVETVNAKDPASVARLASLCGAGQTVALLGSSGVGKSTLINTLRGSSSIATQAVREEDGKGRHTTTVREMHRLGMGGWLMDTPGMRELQLQDAAEGLAEVFDDIVALTLECRFSNCTHEQEPGCAVQGAITAGQLDSARLDRWRKLGIEDAANTAGLSNRRGTRTKSRRPHG